VRSSHILALAAVMILGGCTVGLDSRTAANDPPIWGRIDCRRGEGNPELQKQFDDAKTTCLARGETEEIVSGNAGGSPCMTEQGYVLRSRAEHVAACQGVQQQTGPVAAPMKKQFLKPKAARPPPAPEPTVPSDKQ
jgi:hypothetical protein